MLGLIQSSVFCSMGVALPLAGGGPGPGAQGSLSAVSNAFVAGSPLQPPELVKSLFFNLSGLTICIVLAHAIDHATRFLSYPIGYWIMTCMIRNVGMPAARATGGVAISFVVLGMMAPLAGQVFLLRDMPLLSPMSLIGQAT
jgi:hypothetical protein